MTDHPTHGGDLSKLRSLQDVVAEYKAKRAAIPAEIEAFNAAGRRLLAAACVGGEYGREQINTGSVYERTMEASLLRSAWLHVWNGLNLPTIASAKDKQAFERAIASPPEFTLDNIRASLGRYLENPRVTILRGLAEVFGDLDPAFKSHEKMKIGVKGLPKRVILTGFGDFSHYGKDKLRDLLNALAAVQGKPLVTPGEIALALKDEDALLTTREVPDPHWRDPSKTFTVTARGVRVRVFGNGNAHVFFEPDALRDINLALAEYYGEVLPDCPDDDAARPARRASTLPSRDLQFYPTPVGIAEQIVREIYGIGGARVLEPSCGDGRLMDALVRFGADPLGIEIDPIRALMAQKNGHSVVIGNFLEMAPEAAFDFVVMNPPFYGRHYEKHVRHALRWLKPGGKLVSILPATARYDHRLLDDLDPHWHDLPVGAFADSGTNVCTTVATIRCPKEAR